MRHLGLALLMLPLLAAIAPAHDVSDHPILVIDTDCGLDDVVALAMALQQPEIRLVSVVVVPGASGSQEGLASLERLLEIFNRSDVHLHGPAGTKTPRGEPPFRAGAEMLVRRLLPAGAPRLRRPFDPGAYVVEGRKTVVLALGPLTNLAIALRDPAVRDGIEEILVSGHPDPLRGWNAKLDPEALSAVRDSGLPVEFVVPGTSGRKPARWAEAKDLLARAATPGAALFRALLADERAGPHYRGALGPLHDELAYLYYLGSDPFTASDDECIFAPSSSTVVATMLEENLMHGRLTRRRAIFSDAPWPDELLRADVRERRKAMIENNGEEEWFAQVLLNEVHGHLGAYSVIGVKMGLRAAEILNAPLHGMEVVTHIPPGPPASCLNDGVIVATGSTPGRDLFRYGPARKGEVAVSFTHHGRTVSLRLKDAYRARIRTTIAGLLEKHTLEDAAYWQGVRRLGLDIWETWHRNELFEASEGAASAERTAGDD